MLRDIEGDKCAKKLLKVFGDREVFSTVCAGSNKILC